MSERETRWAYEIGKKVSEASEGIVQVLEGLTEKETTILKYVKENPGSTKQQVVNGLIGKYSRVTIFQTIETLLKYDFIIIKKNRPNSQVHRLFSKEDSPIVLLIHDLDNFETSFFKLLDIIKERFSTELLKDESSNAIMLLSYVFSIYIDVLRAYMTRGIITSSYKTSGDEAMLRRLYTTLFLRFAKMQLRVSSNSYDSLFMFKTSSKIENMMSRPPTSLSDKQSILTLCQQFRIPKEAVEPMFDTLLKINQNELFPSNTKEIKDYAYSNPIFYQLKEAHSLISERARRNAISLYHGCETCREFSVRFPLFFKGSSDILDESQRAEFEKTKEEFVKHINEKHKEELYKRQRTKMKEYSLKLNRKSAKF